MLTRHSQTIWFSWLMIAFAAIGGILYGYDIGIIAAALLFIHKSIPMTDIQSSLLVSAVLGGGAIATLISGPLADLFGRRAMIIASALIFLGGIFLLSFAQQYSEILVGRLTQGIGIGIITITIPLYLAESLPKHVRGRGMSIFQLLLTFGILLASLVSLYYTPTEDWRAMFLSAAVPGIVLLIGACFLPNSPHWLLLKGRDQQALSVLRLSRSEEQAQTELTAMQKLLFLHKHSIKSIFTNLTNKQYTYALCVVFTIAALQQLTGINSLLQFSAYILQQAGLKSNITAVLGSTVITAVNFFITIVALLLIDTVGRKKLLSFGTAGMTISLAFMGLIYFYLPISAFKGYLLLAGIVGFILTYGVGPGVVVWLALSELLPSKVRSTGMAIALFINSMTSSIFASLFLILTHHIGYTGVFWLCSFFSLLYFIMAYWIIPETTNKTLEEIEADFTQHNRDSSLSSTAEA